MYALHFNHPEVSFPTKLSQFTFQANTWLVSVGVLGQDVSRIVFFVFLNNH